MCKKTHEPLKNCLKFFAFFFSFSFACVYVCMWERERERMRIWVKESDWYWMSETNSNSKWFVFSLGIWAEVFVDLNHAFLFVSQPYLNVKVILAIVGIGSQDQETQGRVHYFGFRGKQSRVSTVWFWWPQSSPRLCRSSQAVVCLFRSSYSTSVSAKGLRDVTTHTG
jgi:hypothetical protein